MPDFVDTWVFALGWATVVFAFIVGVRILWGIAASLWRDVAQKIRNSKPETGWQPRKARRNPR